MDKEMKARHKMVDINYNKLSSLVQEFQSLVDDFGEDCILSITYEEDCYDSHKGSLVCKVMYYSLEKEDEYLHRIAMEGFIAKRNKDKELAQLKALQEKYKGEI